MKSSYSAASKSTRSPDRRSKNATLLPVTQCASPMRELSRTLNDRRPTPTVRLACQGDSESIASSKPVASPTSLASLHVLVVDDEPMVCELIERILTDAGHRVRTTNDPQQAIRMVTAESFDLLVTDRSMPLMSGEELAAAAKASRPSTRVLLVTGSGSDEIAMEHIDGFLTKPFTPDSLHDGLLEIFDPTRSSMQRDGAATSTR